MKILLYELFGEYTPVLGPDNLPLDGLAGVDWPYVLGVLLFALCLSCFFGLLRGVFRR